MHKVPAHSLHDPKLVNFRLKLQRFIKRLERISLPRSKNPRPGGKTSLENAAMHRQVPACETETLSSLVALPGRFLPRLGPVCASTTGLFLSGIIYSAAARMGLSIPGSSPSRWA